MELIILFWPQSGGESIDVNQIRSVKVSRGARNIPKAFEIFTGDQTLILKPKDGKNAEEWVQCLNIVVAHSQVSFTLFITTFSKRLFLYSRHETPQWRKPTVCLPAVLAIVELHSNTNHPFPINQQHIRGNHIPNCFVFRSFCTVLRTMIEAHREDN